MELNECINTRRSIRKYQEKTINKEIILEIIKAAQMAPSWKNSQVSRYYVVTSEEKLKMVKECLPEFNQNNTKDAPALIVTTVVDKRSGFDRDGKYVTHIKDGFQFFDNGLQVQNLCLKAHDLGLGTLIMGLYDEQKIREILEIPQEQIIVVVLSLGYPDIEPIAPQRKDINDIVKFS